MPHTHDGNHDHAHHAHHANLHADSPATAARTTRALRIALALTLVLLVAEAIGGWISNSLALLADAGHVLTDAGALGLSLFVAWFCRQPGTPEKTYGYLRWEILAALINGATLLGISVWIVIEAIARLHAPEPVAGTLMLVVAVAGLIANGIAAWLLHPAEGDGLNIRGAYLHILGDLLASAGTIAAALVIRFTGWLAVESVHDLHVWTVTSGIVALSAHAIVRDAERQQDVLEHACDLLAPMGIHHITVQVERREMEERERHRHP
jgi:cobalt-zinc-cadmium efflux system protein